MDVRKWITQLLDTDPETFVKYWEIRDRLPYALQRGLVYLCYSTDMSGSAVIDGKMGVGTGRGLLQFCKELQADTFDPAAMLGVIEQKLLMADEVIAQVNVEFLDRLQSLTAMPATESYMTYYQALVDSGDIAEMGLNQGLALAIIQVETAGIGRVRFESHVWDSNPSLDDRERRFYSTSFGLFQIMGFNVDRCGLSVDYLQDQGDLERQFEVFAHFIGLDRGLLEEFRSDDPNYKRIARRYNGPGSLKNNYHSNLKRAHQEIKGIISTFG